MASEYSQSLAGSTVFVIDPDRVEQRNLQLSRLFHRAMAGRSTQVVGSFKAAVVAKYLNSLPGRQGIALPITSLRWVPYPVEVSDVSWRALRSLDLLVSCTDNALARLETTLAARCLGLPLLDGGVQGEQVDGGRVSFFSPDPEAACYLCGLGEERRAALLAFAAAKSLPCNLPADAALGSSARVSASLQRTAQRMLEELGTLINQAAHEPPMRRATRSWATRVHVSEANDWQHEEIVLRRSLSCPWHTEMRAPMVSVAPDQSFDQVLDGLRLPYQARLQFAWPVCLVAVCRHCGATDQQPRRVALVRRRGVCAHCQTPHQLEPLQTVASVGQNEAMAKMTPRQLGWADHQLVQVRRSLVFASEAMEAC